MNEKKKDEGNHLDSVGTAEMKEDGSIWLRLWSYDSNISAQALKVVKKDDKDYQFHLNHVGGLKPGEFKSIPPYK